MGFFKKIFKPVSKVLDKIIPNEIKPALPYLAAFAPMLMPAAASGSFMSSMLGRGLMSGGANIFSQLAQEGNEGDINELSALLAGGIGALSAPGAGDTLRGGTTVGGLDPALGSSAQGDILANRSFLTKASDSGLGFLAKGADKLQAVNAAGAADPFSMAGLKAAALPFAQGTGDAMYNEAKVAERDYERALREYNEEQEAMGTASNEGRRQAIIQAMTGNHSQEVIDETLAELGLRDGGRVAYNMGGRVGRAYGGGFGGIEAAVQTVKDRDLKENLTIAKDTEMDMKSLAEEFLATYKRQPNSYDELMEFYKKKNGYEAGGEEVVEEQVINAANGGIMGARVPFVSGGFARGLINAAKFSDEAPLMLRSADEVPAGLVDEMGQPLKFKPSSASGAIDEVIDVAKVTEEIPRGPVGPGMLDKMAAGNPQMQAAKEFIESIRGVDGGIDYALAEAQIGRGIKLKGNESIEELIELFLFKPNKKAIAAIGAGYGGLGAGAMMNDTSIQAANGGIMNYNMGGSVLPNGVEMDYRGGGFIPMGSKERADDVPARVSKNEFVMTADAVRAAGGGSVNKGAKKMYELMNNLEARA
jgi:hypothetical protein